MAAARVLIFALVVTRAASALFYEDDMRNAHRQRIADMMSINEVLFAKSRSFTSNSIPVCYALKKEQQLAPSAFQYMVFLPPQPPWNEYVMFPALFTTSATPQRWEPNAVSIMSEEAVGEPSLFKLMYIDMQRGCLILVRKRGPRRRECLLLQSIYSVDALVPEECQSIYLQQCPGRKFVLYRPFCKSFLRRNRRPGH